MNHLSFFESYQEYEEIEDFFLELIENEVMYEDNYSISMDWKNIKASYVIDGLKKDCDSIEDLQHNIKIYQSLINPIKFANLKFQIKEYDQLDVLVPCSENITKFIHDITKYYSEKHLHSGWVIEGALIGIDKLEPNRDFSLNVRMKAFSWKSIGLINKNPEIEKEFLEKLRKYNIENYTKVYRSELEPHGKDYYYEFKIR